MSRNRDATGTARSFCLLTHYDVSLMRISSVCLGTLSGRVTVEKSISCYDTETRYGCYGAGWECEVSQVHGGGVLARSSCAGLARCFSFESFYCDASVTKFFDEMSQTRKKEEALRRVLLFRWTVAESSQSTCPDVCRRGHHWLYRRLHRHCRLQ